MFNFDFRSEISSEYLDDLRSLLFFNSEQQKVADGIIASIERYGMPKVEEVGGKLKVSVEKVPEIQAIYAYDKGGIRDELVGVMLFFRESIDCISLIHIAVKDNYSITSSEGESLLTLEMLYRLKDIARHLKKVEYLSIYYHKYVAKRIIISK